MSQGIGLGDGAVNVADHDASITAPQKDSRLASGRALEPGVDCVGDGVDAGTQVELFEQVRGQAEALDVLGRGGGGAAVEAADGGAGGPRAMDDVRSGGGW